FDWYRWEPIREILLITENSVVMPESRQIPLLDNHSRFTTSDIKGSERNLEIKTGYEKLGNVILGEAHFSATAEKERTLVEEGHLSDTSICYRTFEEYSQELKKGQSAVIDGREFRNDYEDDYPLVIRLRWELKEESLTPIGADDAAKFR